jgi:DNA/RNA endonuclease YhcR with UshA esterase domain
VLTVIVEVVVFNVPGAVIEAGLNVQAAPAGSAEQAREMVPLNPVEDETITELAPVEPGAEMVTDEALAGTAAKNPG